MSTKLAELRTAFGQLQERWPVLAAWPYLLVVALGAGIMLPRLGSIGLWDPWEPKYAQSAREMLERGSFVTPYFLGEVRLTKPILAYWGVLVGYAVFGINEFGARFAGVCMAIGSMVGVLYAVTRVRGRSAGLLCACLLGTTPQFLFMSRQATPDVYLLTSLGCSLVFFALGLFGPDRRRNVHFAIAYAGLALAVLAKGPVIVGVIFGATLAIYGVARTDLRQLWSPEARGETLRLVLGLGAVAAVLGLFALLGFLFGTSSEWWGYSEEKRATVGAFRERILTSAASTAWDRIVLGLLASGFIAALVRSIRQGSSKKRTSGRPGALAVAALITLLVLLVAGPSGRILAGALFGIAVAVWAGIRLIQRFLHQPWLWPRVQPVLRPVSRHLLLATGVLAAVAGPWQLAILIEQGSGYFTDFILKHNVERVADTINRTGASDFYIDVLLYGYFPWSCLIPIAIACLVRWREPDGLEKDGFEAFLLIASLVTVVSFSGSVTKFSHYLGPLLIPLTVVLGLTLHAMQDRKWPAATLGWISAGAIYLPLMLDLTRRNGIRHLISTFTVKREVPSDVPPASLFIVMLWALAALWLLQILVRSRWLVAALVACSAVLGGYLTTTFVPALSHDKTMKALCEVWREHAEPGEPIGVYGDVKFGIYFYTSRQVENLRRREDFFEFMRPGRTAISIVQRSRLTRARRGYIKEFPGHELHTLESSHGSYVTVSNQPLDEE